MTTGRTRFTLTTAALIVALFPAMAAAQPRKVVPVDQVKASKPVPLERGQTPASLGIHGFSVILVVGGTQAAANPADNARDVAQVPEAARKALADMKDFLPYKRYQLLDAAWILCCGSSFNGVSGRIRAADGPDYQYEIAPRDAVGSKLNLRFTMREMQEMPFSPVSVEKMSDTARLELMRQQAETARELDESEIQFRTIQQRFQVGTATPSEMESATARVRRAQQRAQDLQRMAGGGQARGISAQAAVAAQTGAGGRGGGGARAGGTTSNREIMDSSFSISPGETVVIGTSRINGDQALIAILTAATKPGTGR
jgi:hypothetical protein